MVKDRIRKLLNLANDKGASEHEAARAMELATALMLRHGIDASQLGIDGPELLKGAPIDINDRWKQFLARAVSVLYGTLILVTPGRGIEFVGRLDNVDACELTLSYLIDQVEGLYKLALPPGLSRSTRAEFRRTFKEGCSMRVWVRARDIVAKFQIEGVGNSTSLVVQDHRKQLQEEAVNFLKGAMPGVRVQSRSISLTISGGTALGYKAGDQVKFHQEVSQ